MIIVISIGSVITALIYLFGFVFILYILEKILISFNGFLTILNENISHINNLNVQIPLINSLNIQIFFLVLFGSIAVLVSDNDMKQHKNENNKLVHRKEWQKLLDIVNIAMIYPIFSFYEKKAFIDSTQKIYMIGYAVLFLLVFIFAHYYTYINKSYSRFDRICFYIHKIIIVFASVFTKFLLFGVYFFFIYLHDFSNSKNIFISIIYYVFLIFSVVLFSVSFYPSISKNKNIRAIIFDYFFLIIFSIIIGFSSLYNLFIKNCSIYSFHSLIIIDIVLIVLVSTVLLPAKITRAYKENMAKTVNKP